jgi:hypothetical protein
LPRLRSAARRLAGSAALRLAAALAVAAPALLAPRSACAQPAGAPPVPAPARAPHPERYKPHMENGVRLYADKNYRAAIAEFEAAYVAQPKANPLLNLALCYKAEFRYPKAIEVLEQALTKHLDTMDEADRTAAIDAINEMKALLAHVRVTLTPADAQLRIDGEALPPGAAKQPIALGPGKHTLLASRSGYLDASRELAVVSGDDKALTLTLARAPAGSAGAKAATKDAAPAGGGRYSTPLMVVGGVAGGLGFFTVLGGVSVLVFEDALCPDDDPDDPFCDPDKRVRAGVLLTVAGGALLAGGIPMFIVGAGPARSELAPARASLRPEVRVGPGSGALRWAF